MLNTDCKLRIPFITVKLLSKKNDVANFHQPFNFQEEFSICFILSFSDRFPHAKWINIRHMQCASKKFRVFCFNFLLYMFCSLWNADVTVKFGKSGYWLLSFLDDKSGLLLQHFFNHLLSSILVESIEAVLIKKYGNVYIFHIFQWINKFLEHNWINSTW